MSEVDCFPSHLGTNCIPHHVTQESNCKQCLVFILFLSNGDGKCSHVVTERKTNKHTNSGVWGQVAADGALWSGWYLFLLLHRIGVTGCMQMPATRGGPTLHVRWSGKRKRESWKFPRDIWLVFSAVWIMKMGGRKKGFVLRSVLDWSFWFVEEFTSWTFSASRVSHRLLWHLWGWFKKKRMITKCHKTEGCTHGR